MKTLTNGRFLNKRLRINWISCVVSALAFIFLAAGCVAGRDADPEVFKWQMNWQSGETRSISLNHTFDREITAPAELTEIGILEPEALVFVDGLMGGGRVLGQVGESRLTVIEIDLEGAVVEFQILPVPVESFLQPDTDIAEEIRDYFESNTGFTARMRIGSSGTIEQIMMSDELLSEVTAANIFDAGLIYPEKPPPDPAMYERLMQTEYGLDLVRALVESRAGGLFLIRPGDYRVGEVVRDTGYTPGSFPIPIGVHSLLPADFEYTLTEISGGVARFDVLITPSREGIHDVYSSAEEAVAIAFQYRANYPGPGDEEFQEMLSGFMEFTQPKLVHLTVDTASGLPTSAEWVESYDYSIDRGDAQPGTSFDVTYTATFE